MSLEENKYLHKIEHILLLSILIDDNLKDLESVEVKNNPSEVKFRLKLIQEINYMITRKSTKSRKQMKGIFEKYFLKT